MLMKILLYEMLGILSNIATAFLPMEAAHVCGLQRISPLAPDLRPISAHDHRSPAHSAHKAALCYRYQNGTAADELYSQAEDLGVRVPLDMGACGLQEVAYFHQHSDGVDFVFVDHPSYHRAGVLPRHRHAGAATRTAVLCRMWSLGLRLWPAPASQRKQLAPYSVLRLL